MLPSILILAVIFLYAGWVICRKIKRMKNGQYCDCGCDHCSKEVKCNYELEKSNKL